MTVLSRLSPGVFSVERQAGYLRTLRTGLDDLNRQLATGRRAETLGGMKQGRSAALDLRGELARSTAIRQVSERGEVRLNLMNGALTTVSDLARQARSEVLTAPAPLDLGAAQARANGARARLHEAFDQLNSDFDGQYLFSGRATDTRPIPDPSRLIDGTAEAAGLTQLIAERRAADLGSGMGRLGLAQAGASLSIAEENPPPPFGFKIRSLASGLTGGTVSGPDGIPRTATLTLSPLMSAGQTVTLQLSLPDGSNESITLVAREMGAGPAEGTFTLAADIAVTTANLRAALASALTSRASTSLAAASASVAAQDFFAATVSNPARRVSGPPFETATAFAPSGSRPTVTWYQGEDGADAARATQAAALSRGVTVEVGARANEAPIARVLAGLAILAADRPAAGDSLALARSQALAERSAGLLAQPGQGGVNGVIADLAQAQAALGRARERETQRAGVYETALAGIEHPSMEELSAAILAMQTRLEASYHVTANVGRLSLANYLG